MLKKFLIVFSVLTVFFVFVVMTLRSMSKALEFPINEEDQFERIQLDETNVLNGDDFFREEFVFENDFGFVNQGQEPKNLTLKEEVLIAEKLTNFMALDQVKKLNRQEWIQLEAKLGKIDLEELKKMTSGDFIEMLKEVKR